VSLVSENHRSRTRLRKRVAVNIHGAVKGQCRVGADISRRVRFLLGRRAWIVFGPTVGQANKPSTGLPSAMWNGLHGFVIDISFLRQFLQNLPYGGSCQTPHDVGHHPVLCHLEDDRLRTRRL